MLVKVKPGQALFFCPRLHCPLPKPPPERDRNHLPHKKETPAPHYTPALLERGLRDPKIHYFPFRRRAPSIRFLPFRSIPPLRPHPMSAAVRSRTAAAALSAARRIHAGRAAGQKQQGGGDGPGALRRPWTLFRRQQQQEHGRLARAAAAADRGAGGQDDGEPPEIWRQPGEAPGERAAAGAVGRIDVVRVAVPGAGDGSGGKDGAGETAGWGGSNLGRRFPTPKEICRGLDKFVIGQQRAKKVKLCHDKKKPSGNFTHDFI